MRRMGHEGPWADIPGYLRHPGMVVQGYAQGAGAYEIAVDFWPEKQGNLVWVASDVRTRAPLYREEVSEEESSC